LCELEYTTKTHNMSADMPTFKVCFIGATNTGKTATATASNLFYTRPSFPENHIPTLGVEVHLVEIHTTSGPIVLNIWDCAGDERFPGHRQGYYTHAQGVVFFHSLDRDEDAKALAHLADFKTMNPNAHVIHVYAKADMLTTPGLGVELARRVMDPDLHFFSTRTNFRTVVPFEALARKLMNDHSLSLIYNEHVPSE